MPDFGSPYYPYTRVPNGSTQLVGAEKIPYQILRYLLDLPDANGYTPRDDNSRPRVRLAKYLWYDDENPLANPLPTPKEKLSMLFDPAHPDINTDAEKAEHPQGYRLFWQHITKQSILTEKTFLKCYIGRVFTPRPYFTTVGIQFEVWCGSGYETNIATDVESRSFAIEQAVTEALSGVNMTGIGAISFLRHDHTNNGSEPIYSLGSVVGRAFHCSITWADPNADISGECEC